VRVLLDVNMLGRGFSAEVTRTGIFRATEGLIRALMARTDIECGFLADASWVSELQLMHYDRLRGGILQGGMVRRWRHQEGDAAGLELLERILAAESTGGEARRDRAGLMLLNATARRGPPPPGFDLLHSVRTPLPPRPGSPAAVRVLTVHDLIPLQHPEWMYQGAEAEVRAMVESVEPEHDFAIVNSASTGADLATLHPLAPERIFVTPLAADRGVFYPVESPAALVEVRARCGISDGPYLLSLCTVEPRKNLPQLIRAFAAIADRPPFRNIQLILVGPTGWKSEEVFASLAEGGGWRDRVRLTGFLPDADLAALYSGAAAFVYPSLYEGFGLPVLEAMQCGTAVITSSTSSLPEVAGDAADYVDPTDEPALVEALARVLSDPSHRAIRRRQALERARLFSWERTAELTVTAYRQMLGIRDR
jgi:glycosyltransferase involved in cell wall biosynthesis